MSKKLSANTKWILAIATVLMAQASSGAIKTQIIEYKQGDTTLQGYVAYQDDQKVKPGVLVIHDWMGVSDDTKKRADMLAELGYVAFAADIYGKGVRPKNADEAGKEAGKYKKDRKLMRARAEAGLAQLQKIKFVDSAHLAAIGYCFGGTTAVELALDGAPLIGTVVFHAGLDAPHPEDAKNIKGRVLALQGADDPYVPAKDLAAFESEMRDAKVDWQLVQYGNAVHAFTIKSAGNDNSKGAAYNEKADKRSWIAMQDFFKDVFTK